MALFALRRLLLSIPLLIGITFVSYVVIGLAPGAPRLPDPGGSQRLPRGQGAPHQGVRPRQADPRAVLAVAQVRGTARLRPLVAARRPAGLGQDRGAPAGDPVPEPDRARHHRGARGA